MKYNIIKIICLLLVAGIFNSCSDYLDTLPDNRTQLNTEKKISQLLVSAYPKANYSVLAELSSDNFIDNNAYLPVILSSFEKMHEEIFAWQAVTASTEEDSPSYVWEQCYGAIAAANHALVAIDELNSTKPDLDLSAQRAEALMCRAYGHFVLVNIFSQAYKDDIASEADAGIPYVTQPETKVNETYDRGSVRSVYANIQKDIEAGINLIVDQKYSVPKYHFNKKAANAFATRFFLYKRDYEKVIQYANVALSDNPTPLMRDWSVDYDNVTELGFDYISAQQSCNFLLLPTTSVFNRVFGSRYGHNGLAMVGTTYGSGPTWTGMLPCFEGKLYIRGQQDYGVFFPKCDEMFEYTDKIAGIGLAHVVRAELTAEETLLCRAEALIYLNRFTEALSDLQLWNKARSVPTELTDENIKSFYVSNNAVYVKKLNTTKMSAGFTVSTTQLPYINCILHFRRIETIFDGYRWFDIKRYGIEIEHAIANAATLKLTYNDARRAIQLPLDVLSAGLNSNPGTTTVMSSSAFEKLQK